MKRELDSAAWQRLFDLYSDLSELPSSEREPFLASIRSSDPEVAEELEAMLAAGAQEGALEIERRLADESSRDGGPQGAEAGSRLGAYRLIRLLGRGGMGEVHLAERIEGGFEQFVAIKVLRAGLLGAEAIDRFHRERAIQARLVHPSIVPLLDGGVAPDGRPYLVLQYIDGRPITKFADERGLSIESRLRLVIAAGRAVEFAHSRLVVHRDLKPSNILVSEGGDVHLLDFGIARLLDDAEGMTLTRDSPAPMTPERAAPEQLRGDPPSTATDVWGLGVLLYEMLTGHLPFVADARDTTPDRLPRALRGDLEMIVARALHVEPDRRYASATALVADLEAFLDGRPVVARPDSAAYRFRRLIGRHRAASAATMIAIVSLFALAGGSFLQATRVARERDRATHNERVSSALVEVLVEVLGETDPRSGSGVSTISIPDLLKKADERVTAMTGEPAVQARLWHRLGTIHFERSEAAKALELYERALAASSEKPRTDEARSKLLLDYARALEHLGRTKEAEETLRPLVADLETASDPQVLAHALQLLGERVGGDEGFALVERSLAMRRRMVPAQPQAVAASLHSLALIQFRRELRTEARTIWREALAIIEAEKGFDNPDTRAVMSGLAAVLDDPKEQEAIHRRLLASIERQLGPEAQGLAFGFNNLGVSLAVQRRHAEADEALREAQRRWHLLLGPAHMQTQRSLGSIARNLEFAGRSEEALTVYQEIRKRRVEGGAKAPPLLSMAVREAEALTRLNRLESAETLLAATRKELAVLEPAGALDTASSEVALGRLRLARGNASAAVAAIRKGVALREGLLSADSPLLAEARAELGAALLANGEIAEGKSLLAASLPRVASWGAAHPADVARLQQALAAH